MGGSNDRLSPQEADLPGKGSTCSWDSGAGLPGRWGLSHCSVSELSDAWQPARVASSSAPLCCRGHGSPLRAASGIPLCRWRRSARGSTTTLTDTSGNVVASYTYDAYGNLVQVEDTVGNRLRFTGLASDPTTGLIYARARWYDPTTGRFLTTDPATCGSHPSCGCRDGSAYAYAGDNPVNRVDPGGKIWVDAGATILGQLPSRPTPASWPDWVSGYHTDYLGCVAQCDTIYFELAMECWGVQWTMPDPRDLGGGQPITPGNVDPSQVFACESIVGTYETCVMNCGTSFWVASQAGAKFYPI